MSSKYELLGKGSLSYNPDTKSYILTYKNYQPPVMALPKGFMLKDEFHLTLIGKKRGESLEQIRTSDYSIHRKVMQMIKDMNWKVELTDQFYRVKKSDLDRVKLESLIQMVKVPTLETLYQLLKKMIPLSIRETFNLDENFFETPPAHITFATKGNREGIGIHTTAELESLKPKKLW